MYDETVDDSPARLKTFLLLCKQMNILYFNEDSSNPVLNCIEMGVLKIDLKNINLDNNFDENNPDSIILIRLLASRIKFEKRKALKNIK